MIISELNHLEIVSEAIEVEGGCTTTWSENDQVTLGFTTTNNFTTTVNTPYTNSNSASAGAKGVANGISGYMTFSYTKADTLAVTTLYDGSFSASTSVAVINRA